MTHVPPEPYSSIIEAAVAATATQFTESMQALHAVAKVLDVGIYVTQPALEEIEPSVFAFRWRVGVDAQADRGTVREMPPGWEPPGD